MSMKNSNTVGNRTHDLPACRGFRLKASKKLIGKKAVITQHVIYFFKEAGRQ
jgi:hypothetical protein